MEWKKCIWQWKANKFPVNDEDTLFKTWPAISGRQYVAGYRPLPSLRSTYPACDKDRVVESIFLTAPKGVAVCLPLPAAMAWCLHPQVHPVCGASGVRWVVVFRKLLMMLLLPSTTRFFFTKFISPPFRRNRCLLRKQRVRASFSQGALCSAFSSASWIRKLSFQSVYPGLCCTICTVV